MLLGLLSIPHITLRRYSGPLRAIQAERFSQPLDHATVLLHYGRACDVVGFRDLPLNTWAILVNAFISPAVQVVFLDGEGMAPFAAWAEYHLERWEVMDLAI